MNTIFAAGLTGLVAGAVAASVVVMVGTPSTTEGTAGPQTLTADGAPVSGELGDVVARLDREHVELRDSFQMHQANVDQRFDEVLTAINRRAMPAVADGGADEPDTAAAMGLDPASLPAVDAPEFEMAVAAAIENIEAREREEREAEREAREIERMEERLAELRTKLGLDQYQETEMRTLMLESAQKFDDMREVMRSGEMDRGEVRQAFDDIRTDAETTLQSILSPAQYQQYQDENMGGFGGFGGGRPRGGGGPGGGGAPVGGPF